MIKKNGNNLKKTINNIYKVQPKQSTTNVIEKKLNNI